MSKYLDYTQTERLWGKIKTLFGKAWIKGSSTSDSSGTIAIELKTSDSESVTSYNVPLYGKTVRDITFENNILSKTIGTNSSQVVGLASSSNAGFMSVSHYSKLEGISGSYYGSSSSGASSGLKYVSCSGFVLSTGACVSILFSTANTVSSSAVQLNINNTGEKTVYVNGAATSSSNTLLWGAGDILSFVYDGTGYQFIARQSANVPMTDAQILAAVEVGWGSINDDDVTSY